MLFAIMEITCVDWPRTLSDEDRDAAAGIHFRWAHDFFHDHLDSAAARDHVDDTDGD